jgi:hypothetical protein
MNTKEKIVETKTLELENKLSKFHGWQKRNRQIKQGKNFAAWVDSDGHLQITSYSWWKIVTFNNGVYLFNWYSYSNSTRKHQHEAARIVRELGIDCITVDYHQNIGDTYTYSLKRILEDKLDMLYTGENEQALSRARKYAVYTEDKFNELLSDIRVIAAALKIKDKELDKMLIAAEDKANEELVTKLVDQYERQRIMREMRKANNNLGAIQL